VRVVASPKKRVEMLRQAERLSEKEAGERMKSIDTGRRGYVRSAFQSDVDEVSLVAGLGESCSEVHDAQWVLIHHAMDEDGLHDNESMCIKAVMGRGR
jgi:hypothetical protein